TIVRPALRGTGADGATVEVPLVHEDAATDVFEHDSFPAPAVAAANVASRDDASQDSAANAAMQDDDVIELDPVDPTALETMNWSFEHFPEQQAATEPEPQSEGENIDLSDFSVEAPLDDEPTSEVPE